MLCDILQVLSI